MLAGRRAFRPTGLTFKSGSKLWSLNWARNTNETMMRTFRR